MKNILAIVLICIFSTSCARQAFPVSERWEGIKDNVLRIYIQLEIPYNYMEKNVEQKMTEQLMKAGINRCAALLDIYIGLKMPAADRDFYTTLRTKLYKITQKGVMRHASCGENYCRAFVDFDISDLLIAIARKKTDSSKNETR